MRVDLFDFELPEDRIALRPASPRKSARLMHIAAKGAQPFAEHTIGDLPDLLRPGDMLVFNDTRVLPAALAGFRLRGDSRVAISLNLHKQNGPVTWRAFARPAKRIAVGDTLVFGENDLLSASVSQTPGQGEIVIEFDAGPGALPGLLDSAGTMPLPPYIASKRPADTQDLSDYQNIYADREGSVAAPTAGFHFTQDLMTALTARGIELAFLTLHVGAGTFLPVKSEETDEHTMHAEYGEISEDLAMRLNEARNSGQRIICVGTTSLRLLESAATAEGKIEPFTGETDIFITPGYAFRAADALITNFHLPRSTLFMLVSALAGLETMQAAYRQAVENGFRFYSYGDACLIEKAAAA